VAGADGKEVHRTHLRHALPDNAISNIHIHDDQQFKYMRLPFEVMLGALVFIPF
jgi:hypothetical protein